MWSVFGSDPFLGPGGDLRAIEMLAARHFDRGLSQARECDFDSAFLPPPSNRSTLRATVATGILGNRLIVWGVVLEVALVLLIDYTTWGNIIFGTAPIEMRVWLFIIPFAIGMAVLEELRKWLVRQWRP